MILYLNGIIHCSQHAKKCQVIFDPILSTKVCSVRFSVFSWWDVLFPLNPSPTHYDVILIENDCLSRRDSPLRVFEHDTYLVWFVRIYDSRRWNVTIPNLCLNFHWRLQRINRNPESARKTKNCPHCGKDIHEPNPNKSGESLKRWKGKQVRKKYKNALYHLLHFPPSPFLL